MIYRSPRFLGMTLLSILICLSSGALCQQIPQEFYDLESFQPTPKYQQASDLLALGKREEGITLLLEIADENPGSSLGISSLFLAARMAETPEQFQTIMEGATPF